MPHLVASITESRDIQVTTDQLRAAHDYLVAAAKTSVTDHRSFAIETWGQSAKRGKVILPAGPRPVLISKQVGEHAFAEVVNQCATIERLLDGLAWAKDAFKRYEVTTCHPTTGSVRDKKHDHDLVLSGPDGRVALFEVSDVASEKDGNGKEMRDVRQLLPDLKRPASPSDPASLKIRRFLVVSQEFSRRLLTVSRRTTFRNRYFHYKVAGTRGTTVILEVLRGSHPSIAASFEK